MSRVYGGVGHKLGVAEEVELQLLSSGSQGMMWNLWVGADFADFLRSGPSAACIPWTEAIFILL